MQSVQTLATVDIDIRRSFELPGRSKTFSDIIEQRFDISAVSETFLELLSN